MALIELEYHQPKKLTNREKRLMKKADRCGAGSNNSLKLKSIKPLTESQKETFKEYDNGKNLLLHGVAGTGKSFISLYLALEDVLSGLTPYHKVLIIRTAVPSRDQGFLPGNLKEKMKQYEDPYVSICTELFGRGDAYDVLKNKGIIDFTTTSYLRGLTFNNSIIILDEYQNGNFSELETVITRIGDNSKIIICGDFRQTDLNKHNDMSGLKKINDILLLMESVAHVEFKIKDILRSHFVKEFIISKEKLGY